MMLAQIDMLPLRPIASEAIAVSTRSTRKVTLEVPANADCKRLGETLEQRLDQADFDVREGAFDVHRRLGAVRTEHRLDHREDEIAIQNHQDPGVPLLGVEHGRDRIGFVVLDDVADAPVGDAVDGESSKACPPSAGGCRCTTPPCDRRSH